MDCQWCVNQAVDRVLIINVFFKFLSSQIFVKSRQLWDQINIISSAYLDSWSNESNRQKLAEKPANFAGCRLFYTTLWPIVPQLIVLFGIARYASKQMLMKMRIIICSLILKAMAHWVSCYKGSNSVHRWITTVSPWPHCDFCHTSPPLLGASWGTSLSHH